MNKSVFKILVLTLLLICVPSIKAEASQNGINLSTILRPAGIDLFLIPQMTIEEYIEVAESAEGSTFGYTNLALCNITEANNLNIRSIPASNGRIIGKLPRNAACEVMYEDGEWSYIASGNVEGYVKSEFLLTGFAAVRKAQELATLVAVVTTDSLKVREEPNTDCDVITQVPRGEVLEVEEVLENGWVKIILDAEFAFVSGEFVTVKYDLRTAITMTELLYGEGVSDIRVDVCEFAKRYLGNPYVWGGTSLTRGADCSGFVQSVFRNFGVRLPRSSVQQATVGTRISVSDLKAGDLIFYARGGRIDHVALYIGGGRVIHASTARTGIIISRYNYRTPHMYRRVLYD